MDLATKNGSDIIPGDDRVYPYQNCMIESMTGEEWKELPGMGGHFLISNFGRVKRLFHKNQLRNGAFYPQSEKIIKPFNHRGFNKSMGDYIPCLTGCITIGGKHHRFTLVRMVYYCFVEHFDLHDRSITILTRDRNNFNIIPANLMKATVQEKLQRVDARRQLSNHHLKLSEAVRKKIRDKMMLARQKMVSQYSMAGKKIATYVSAAQASRTTGIHVNSISQIANGKGISAGGYVWRWGNDKKTDVQGFIANRKKMLREKKGQKVTQYAFTGKKIAQYPSIQDAHIATGTPLHSIRQVIKGLGKSANGYFWKKGYGKSQIDLSGHVWGRKSQILKQSKKVEQYSLSGKYKHSFKSIKEAAASIGVSQGTISRACSARTERKKICHGYKWRLA